MEIHYETKDQYIAKLGLFVVLTPQIVISHQIMTIGMGIHHKILSKNITPPDFVQILWNIYLN